MIDYSPTIPKTGFDGGSFFLDIARSLGDKSLWVVLATLAIVISISTFILYYHWMRYAFGDRMIILAQVLYTVVVLGGFVVMISALNYYA